MDDNQKLRQLAKQSLCSLTDLASELLFELTKDLAVLTHCEQAFKEVEASNDFEKIVYKTYHTKQMLKLLKFAYAAKNQEKEFLVIHKKWKEKYANLHQKIVELKL